MQCEKGHRIILFRLQETLLPLSFFRSRLLWGANFEKQHTWRWELCSFVWFYLLHTSSASSWSYIAHFQLNSHFTIYKSTVSLPSNPIFYNIFWDGNWVQGDLFRGNSWNSYLWKMKERHKARQGETLNVDATFIEASTIYTRNSKVERCLQEVVISLSS